MSLYLSDETAVMINVRRINVNITSDLVYIIFVWYAIVMLDDNFKMSI